APGLSLPANGSLSSTYLPTLDWKDATPAGGSYELQVATNNQFQPVALDVPSLSASTYSFTSALDPNTTYYWRVQATSLTGQVSPWSPVWSFRTVLLPPALSLPASGTYVQTTFPTLSWSDPNTSGVTGYTIQISKNNTFTSIVTTGTSTIPSYTPAKALPINSTLYWRVQVKGGNGPSLWSSSPAWSFLTGNGPSIPVPLSPANNSLTTSYTNPAFTWKASIAPSGTSFDHYQIQIGTDTSFSSPVTDATTTVPSYPSSLTLLPDTTYSWHVRAYNTIGDFSGWSATWSLRTALPPPTLTAPATGTDPLTLRPTFSWNAVGPGASSYSIQVSKNDSFTQLVLSAVTTTPNLTPAKDLPAASVAPILYWHVQAQGPNGPSLWSSPARTITSPNPPSIPVLTSPANGSLSTSPVYQPTLSWKAVTVPSSTAFGHYHVQVATSNTFASTVVDDTSVSTITYPQLLLPAALNPNTTYYWRVSAVNSANEASAWSATWSFRTLLAPPILLSPADTATGVPARPAFTWGDPNTSGVTGYTIQISKSSTFASILLAGSTTATTRTFTPTSNLASGTQYFWRVQVKGTNGPSAWPTYFSFSTQ
ncbi:MAG TPA: hypothetical protein VLZ89_11565, partial [Anaerolineales bacterium]|nr:hypothetical protein [Anaerolineales bacterium]